jgi:hypothetical protein
MKTIFDNEVYKIELQLKKERGVFQRYMTNSKTPCIVIWKAPKAGQDYNLVNIINLNDITEGFEGHSKRMNKKA